MEKKFNKILILRLSAIGDTIHTLPLASVIKKNYPECKIGWVVEDKAQLFIKNNPLVDKCYVLPKKEWKKRGFSLNNLKEFKNIIDEINSENYDLVIDTQQLFKTAMILPFLNIKRKIALTGGREFSYLFINEKVKASHKLFDPNYHVVNRTLELASYLGMDISNFEMQIEDVSEDIKEKIAKILEPVDNTKRTVVFSPATTWSNKHWSESHWIETAKSIKDKVNLIFTGTQADLPLINRIVNGAKCENALVLAGKTNLLELEELFKNADVVVSPDSGSAHIAWAVSKPHVVTIFTSTAEKRSGPFGEKCHILAPEIQCHPCLKKQCPNKNKSEKDLCTRFVKPEELVNLLNNILHL